MKMAYVLIAVVGASASVGILQSFAGSPEAPSSAAVAPAAIQAAAPLPGDEGDEAAAPAEITGDVLEVIDVPNYSYYRVGAKGSEGTWVAVPSAKLKVGDHARVGGAMKMQSFKSTTLGRTFPEIYFGSLVVDGAPAALPASPHGAGARQALGADPHGAGADPHQGASTAPSSVEVKPVARAAGPNGRTGAEIIGQRSALNGKTVRVHATVVKSTPGVMGRTYVHLRDGSGDAASGTNDLTITTEATPAVGETIELEGVVALDRDIGSGYKFPTLVEDCKVQPASPVK